jgi:hypothetical protein
MGGHFPVGLLFEVLNEKIMCFATQEAYVSFVHLVPATRLDSILLTVPAIGFP